MHRVEKPIVHAEAEVEPHGVVQAHDLNFQLPEAPAVRVETLIVTGMLSGPLSLQHIKDFRVHHVDRSTRRISGDLIEDVRKL